MAKDFVTVRILDLPGTGGGCACSSTPRGPEFIAALMHKCEELNRRLLKPATQARPAQNTSTFLTFPRKRNPKRGNS